MEFLRKLPQLPTATPTNSQVWRLSAFGSILPILLHDTCVRIQHWIPQLRRFRFVSKCRFMHWKHCHLMFNRLKLMSVSSTVLVEKIDFSRYVVKTFKYTFYILPWKMRILWKPIFQRKKISTFGYWIHSPQKSWPTKTCMNRFGKTSAHALVFKAPYYIRSTRAGRELLLSHGSNGESPWPNQQVFTISWKYGRNFNRADSNSSRFRRATKTRTKRVYKQRAVASSII